MRKICVFTGTRAEYGLLRPVMRRVQKIPEFELQVMVSGAHLAAGFGHTVDDIVADGLPVSEQVEMLLDSDTPVAVATSMGVGLMGMSGALDRLRPDMLVILGDRYESMAAAIAASILRIPIAHIHGGETTEGAVDEALRHSITKMSHLHFTSTAEYRRRVVQLGEPPERVFNVGALGVENILTLELPDRAELEKELGFDLGEGHLLTTFHPVTLENETATVQFGELLRGLDAFPERKIVFTKANADADGRVINAMIDDYVQASPKRCIASHSMGLRRYLGAMRLCGAVVGNSSSGILEAPSMGVPTVDIGDRQRGRVRAVSVFNCAPEAEAVAAAIRGALEGDWEDTVNPYEGQATSERIVEALGEALTVMDIKKRFFDVPFDVEGL